jgi:hypothetical protein
MGQRQGFREPGTNAYSNLSNRRQTRAEVVPPRWTSPSDG